MATKKLRSLAMPMRACRVPLTALLATVAWGTAGAASLYVDNINACNGLAPCYRTITQAVTAAAPGDVVEVFGGVYEESVEISGGKGGLVLKAQHKARPPVITGGLLISGSGNVQVLNLFLESGVAVGGGATSGLIIEDNVFAGSGIDFRAALAGTARNNTFMSGGINVAQNSSQIVIEGNTIHGGSVTLGGEDVWYHVVRRNVIRGGGISLSAHDLRANLVEANYVSGGSGIRLSAGDCCSARNVVQRNISVDSDGCDIGETNHGPGILTTWRLNSFVTKCGTATN